MSSVRLLLLAAACLLAVALVAAAPTHHQPAGALEPEQAPRALSEVEASVATDASAASEFSAEQKPAAGAAKKPAKPLLDAPADLSEASMRAKFEEYKVQNRKTYRRPADEARAFTLFKRNRFHVYALNKKVGKKIFSTTGKFAAVDEQEFKARYLGRGGSAQAPKTPRVRAGLYVRPNAANKKTSAARPRSLVQMSATHQAAAAAQAEFMAELQAQQAQEAKDGIVMEVDWRSIITPVKDQSKCGSCWAHGSTAGLEAAVGFLNKRPTTPLSPQALMDCRPWKTSSFESCQGDHETKPFNIWMDTPATLLTEYPYAANRSATQSCTKVQPKGPTVNAWGYIIPKCSAMNCARDEAALLASLKAKGPITVSVHASSFQFYKTSVLPGGDEAICSKDPSKVNHVMQIVGYGTEAGKPFWLVRNSWGPDWARAGFIHLEFGKNTCGIANEPIWITADPYPN